MLVVVVAQQLAAIRGTSHCCANAVAAFQWRVRGRYASELLHALFQGD